MEAIVVISLIAIIVLIIWNIGLTVAYGDLKNESDGKFRKSGDLLEGYKERIDNIEKALGIYRDKYWIMSYRFILNPEELTNRLIALEKHLDIEYKVTESKKEEFYQKKTNDTPTN